jgi:hypothetical protein
MVFELMRRNAGPIRSLYGDPLVGAARFATELFLGGIGQLPRALGSDIAADVGGVQR